MKKLTYTKREAIKLHRKLWNSLASSGIREKPFLNIINNCYFCHYAFEKSKGRMASHLEIGENINRSVCKHCPGVWPKSNELLFMNNRNDSPCEKSHYGEWTLTDKTEFLERMKLAKQIAEIEIK